MKLIIANFKMNLSLEQSVNYCTKVMNKNLCNNNFIICPPSIYLSYLLHKFPKISFGAQDVSKIDADFGAFTGEISAYILASSGIKYVIINHLERRNNFDENDSSAIQKLDNCIKNNITPILCISDEGTHFINKLLFYCTFLKRYNGNLNEVIFAYEPQSSVGTSRVIDPIKNIFLFNQAKEVISQVDLNIKLVYGGSVNASNIDGFLKINSIDGLLIGSASLIFDDIEQIVNKSFY